LQDKFDCLIDGYIDHQVGQTGDFLDATLADHLKDNLHALYAGRQMRTAGIGNDVVQGHDALIRSDVIYWLDRAHNDPYENQFFALVDAFIEHLNRTCYAGITGCDSRAISLRMCLMAGETMATKCDSRTRRCTSLDSR
jgi:SM-20-related protein